MRIILLGDINSAHTQRWARGLKNFDHVIHVISLNPPDKSACTDGISYSDLGISSKWSKGTSSVNKAIYLSVWFRLQKEIRAFKPTFIHAHFASSYGLLALISLFRPYYISLWGSDIMEFPYRSKIHKIILGQILRSSQRVFSTSEVMQDIAYNLYGIKSFKIPFGIDSNQFSSVTSTSESPLIIGTIKRLESIYAIDILIKAFARVAMSSRMKLELRIVGSGSIKKELEALVNKLGIASFVVFVDRVPYHQVPDQLSSFHIFVNLSRRESFGVSVLEASASSLPVLVSSINGLKEVYIEGETAMVAEVENVDDTANKLSLLIGDPSLRKKLGENGRRFVKSNFEWARCVEQLNTYYQNDFSSI